MPLDIRLPIRRRSRRVPRATRAAAEPRVRHPLCSRLYASQVERAEELGLRERRRDLLAGLHGRVLEIGAGTGINLRHYPPTVEEVVLVEPEPYLRARLMESAAASSMHARIVAAPAERLPYEDGSFDAAVSCLVLCSVGDVDVAIGELVRVLRPGGELRFMEHVVSARPMRRRAQQLADATVWPLLSGGCHLGRDTLASLSEVGFRIDRHDGFGFRIGVLDPPKTVAYGVARLETRQTTGSSVGSASV